MASGPPTVELSAAACGELGEIARRTGRSVAFIARRALAAAAPVLEKKVPPGGARAKLVLTTDEDDARDTIARLRAAAGARPLGEAIEAAWAASREKFFAWAAREEAAGAAERADELDAGLRDAQAPATSPARLAELAASAYPRVRLLACAHPSLPADALARLAGDRERVVREAALQAAAGRPRSTK